MPGIDVCIALFADRGVHPSEHYRGDVDAASGSTHQHGRFAAMPTLAGVLPHDAGVDMDDAALENDVRTEMILCAGLCLFGFILMFVAHFVASFGPDTGLEGGWLPYWWTYLLLYPVTAFQVTPLAPRRLVPISLALCAAPVLYFLALGVLESDWRASSAAWLGSLITLVLCMLVGYVATVRTSQNNAR